MLSTKHLDAMRREVLTLYICVVFIVSRGGGGRALAVRVSLDGAELLVALDQINVIFSYLALVSNNSLRRLR